MKKNVASQVVCAQLVSKTDGSAVTTGTTLVYVLGDGGTQALGEGTGSPSGQAIHEGQGLWSYTPTQADTNYDNVCFTFVNSTAVNATIQIYTSFPQTGDNYARLGAPAGASVSADVAAVKVVLPSALGANGNIKSDVRDYNGVAGTFASGRAEVNTTHIAGSAVNTSSAQLGVNVVNAAGTAWNSGAISASTLAADAITDAKVAADVTIASVTGAVGSVTGAVGSVTGNVGGNVTGSVGSVVGAVGSVTGLTASDVGNIKLVTDKLNSTLQLDDGSPTVYQFTPTALENGPSGSGPSASTIADAVWDELIAGHLGAGSTGESLSNAGSAGNPWSTVIEGSYTAEDLIRIIAAVAVGKTTISGTTVTFRDVTDATNIITALMSGSQRQTVTLAP